MNLPEIKNNIIYATTQINAWVDEDIFKEYIKKIIIPYKKDNKKILLIMDYSTSHYTEKIIDYLDKHNIDVCFITKNMTSILQPLDRAINFPFKQYLKSLYSERFIFYNEKSKNDNNIKNSRNYIISDIIKIWYGSNLDKDDYIKKELVINSFKICGISNDMNGIEDDMFDGYEIISELLDKKNEIRC